MIRLNVEKILIVIIAISMIVFCIRTKAIKNNASPTKHYEMVGNSLPNYHSLPKPIKSRDKLDILFEKFNVPYEYQDYTRQLCELQNVDPLVFVSLVNIESRWGVATNGVASDYNKELSYRMYGKNKQYADLGLGQLSTRYAEEQETRYFNPELIFSLGYVRARFDQRDPIINLQVSCAYLGFLYRYFGSYELAVQSYNCGLGTVLRGNTPEITYEYANAIMNNWKYREKDV